jgi:hypothetical protein
LCTAIKLTIELTIALSPAGLIHSRATMSVGSAWKPRRADAHVAYAQQGRLEHVHAAGGLLEQLVREHDRKLR